jgi:hypothetical protein
MTSLSTSMPHYSTSLIEDQADRNFFALYPDPDTDQPLDEEEASLETALRDHAGQPLDWTRADLSRVREETQIPDTYLRAVECARMRVDTHGIAWTCHPKHLDADVRTSTFPWELLEGQRLFGAQSGSQ